tara:strand:+ start:88817 stop:89434 length:618 start_codon:yes stop_codon:yes gene_type:complete
VVQPRKTPKQARAKQRVADILTAAETLLANEGYDNFSTNRVAKDADINIASLYQYFPNKESLVYAINRKMLDEVIEGCQRYESLMPNMGWQQLFEVMDNELITDTHHVKLVRALDYAIYTNEDLMAMELEHEQRIAAFYAKAFSFYGSKWPESSLLNSGRLIYKMNNISYYDLGHLNDRDLEESMKLYKQHLYSLIERIISQPKP